MLYVYGAIVNASTEHLATRRGGRSRGLGRAHGSAVCCLASSVGVRSSQVVASVAEVIKSRSKLHQSISQSLLATGDSSLAPTNVTRLLCRHSRWSFGKHANVGRTRREGTPRPIFAKSSIHRSPNSVEGHPLADDDEPTNTSTPTKLFVPDNTMTKIEEISLKIRSIKKSYTQIDRASQRE